MITTTLRKPPLLEWLPELYFSVAPPSGGRLFFSLSAGPSLQKRKGQTEGSSHRHKLRAGSSRSRRGAKEPQKHKMMAPSLGGLEPPTFRLTAERANRLRHRDRAAAAPPRPPLWECGRAERCGDGRSGAGRDRLLRPARTPLQPPRPPLQQRSQLTGRGGQPLSRSRNSSVGRALD